MTAEVAILNRNAIALAADSAVTLGSGKVFNSVNKLFSLSKFHPVGIMIYGDASFCAIPWETVIKMYRQKLGKKRFNTLAGYAKDFLSYLETEKLFQSKDSIASYFDRMATHPLRFAAEQMANIFPKPPQPPLTGKQVLDAAYRLFKEIESTMLGWPCRHTDAAKYSTRLTKEYSARIDALVTNIFGTLPLPDKHRRLLRRIAVLSILRDQPGSLGAGLVIAGFGEREIFPSYLHYSLNAVFSERLKYVEQPSSKLHKDNPDGIIAPFAQSESAWAFMAGIDPAFSNNIYGFVNGLLTSVDSELAQIGQTQFASKASQKKFEKARELLRNKHPQILKGFMDEVENWKQVNHLQPLMTVVASLPKDEMGALAESLVSLTSYKRRFSPNSETVGGPIDVAVVSKGDGFVWIKRKHYFEPHLNPQFFTKYYYEYTEEATDP